MSQYFASSLWRFSSLFVFIIVALTQKHVQSALIDTPLDVWPKSVDVMVGTNVTVEFQYKDELRHDIELDLATSTSEIEIDPTKIFLTPENRTARVWVSGRSVTSRVFVDVAKCSAKNGTSRADCAFNISAVFVEVKVVHSNVLSVLVTLAGWIYFVAWSISFYPQIVLNYQRKSVVGLNFDFLVLNIIGFTCYTVYNVMLYFDKSVQEIYIENDVRALIPVLLNDVVFSTYALIACLVTGLQCFIYKRGNQRISYICRGWGSFLVLFAVVSLAITVFNLLNWLQFINFLSYVKLAVTLSKYFPQAILNFRRKSTVGWSIGNILLDFTGGVMDIFQMILQASNTNDWTAFYGNPVKFGLGFVSIFFDIFFMIQHYILYRHPEEQPFFQEQPAYGQVGTIDSASPAASPVPEERIA